jgi:hypothetical protein
MGVPLMEPASNPVAIPIRAVNGPTAWPKRMKMIGGPLKPFFGLRGVHFQVPGNHFRRSGRTWGSFMA